MGEGADSAGSDGGENSGERESSSPPSATQSYSSLLASAAAGVMARFPCHPLDTAKARLQVQSGSGISQHTSLRYGSLIDALRKTAAREGFRGLYRGFGITAVGSAPATCLYLTSYDSAKNSITSASPFFKQNEFLAHFMSGIIAEAFSCVLWVPIDVTKERLQVQESTNIDRGTSKIGSQQPAYRGSVDAISRIMRTEGLSGIYRGYGATIMSFGPYSAFYFMFYEQIKSKSLELYFKDSSEVGPEAGNSISLDRDSTSVEEAPFLLHLVNSSVASVMASFVTNPLDLVKLRLQVQRGMSRGSMGTQAAGQATMPWGDYSGMLDGLAKIVRSDGFQGLFRGATARMAFHGPSMALTIASFETLKTKMSF